MKKVLCCAFGILLFAGVFNAASAATRIVMLEEAYWSG
jgi:hypothetical protein